MTPARLTQMLENAREVEPLSTARRSRMRQALVARIAGRQWHQRPLMLASTFAFAVILGIVVMRAAVEKPQMPQLELSANARHQGASNERIALNEGALSLLTRTPFTVQTPHLEVVISRGRAAFQVVNEQTRIELLEGEGVARVDDRTVRLRVGEAITSSDVRLRARVQLPEPPPDSRCNGATACLEQVALSDDLSAQTAMVRLGLNALAQGRFEQAAELSTSGLTRFPQGVLEPEMHLVRLQSLAKLGRDAEARAEGRWYLEHAARDSAAPGVALLMGDLAMRAGAYQAAREAYAKTLTLEPSAELAAEARIGIERAQQSESRVIHLQINPSID